MTRYLTSTRSPSFSIALWVGLAAVVAYLHEGWQGRKLEWGRIRPLIVVLALWAGVTVLTFALLWPAMWVNPLGVLYEVIWSALFRYASAPRHEHFNYFMGVTGPDPGPLFYPVALLLDVRDQAPQLLTGIDVLHQPQVDAGYRHVGNYGARFAAHPGAAHAPHVQ